jgi:tRNA G37 N-methylase Trm5
MIKPEHRDDLQFIARAIFQHELSNKKVYNEQDLVRDYYRIQKRLEPIFDDIDIEKLTSDNW